MLSFKQWSILWPFQRHYKTSLVDFCFQEHEVDVLFSTPPAKYNKIPGQPAKWEKIFVNYTPDKCLLSRVYKRTLITQ